MKTLSVIILGAWLVHLGGVMSSMTFEDMQETAKMMRGICQPKYGIPDGMYLRNCFNC